MARPKQPYCPHCAGDIQAAKQALQARLEEYIERVPKAYNYEMAYDVFPLGPTSICLYQMNMALVGLGYIMVRDSPTEPTYWVTQKHYAKNKAKLERVIAELNK